ncbi:MAG TPA: LysR family transcriptional regulator, partial [Flavobacteriales bacterium]|nr:LysR family transcriptional regulator [Flavobacteriales bacterium]
MSTLIAPPPAPVMSNHEMKRLSKDEVLTEALAYFKGDDLAATTWLNKYALRDKDGHLVESGPADMHRRMAKEFARIEAKYMPVPAEKRAMLSAYGKTREHLDEERIFKLFDGFRDVVPQGSVMASLGDRYRLASLSNCVVIPSPLDSYGGIFHNDQQLAQLFKRRCGVGFDLSTLRPEGAHVSNAARTSTGAVSFMERFSNTTREVAQKGRRGALMLTMDIAHPDVEKFITIKQDLSKVTGANVSVRVSDEFLQAVEADADFTLRWPINAKEPTVTKQVAAMEARLKVRLLNRNTRGVSLTEAGEAYYREASQLLQQLDDLDNSILDQTAAPRGLLRVSAARNFGEMILAPAIFAFL